MGEEIRSTANQSTFCFFPHILSVQEADAKYRDSKKELDELVASMEGL